MKSDAVIRMGVIVTLIAIIIGAIVAFALNMVWPLVNAAAFSSVFFLMCLGVRNVMEYDDGTGVFLIFLSAGIACLISFVLMAIPNYHTETAEVVPDAITRNPELGNRLTVNLDEDVFTTTLGKIWVLEDSNIVIRVEQDYNLYGLKTGASRSAICERDTMD